MAANIKWKSCSRAAKFCRRSCRPRECSYREGHIDHGVRCFVAEQFQYMMSSVYRGVPHATASTCANIVSGLNKAWNVSEGAAGSGEPVRNVDARQPTSWVAVKRLLACIDHCPLRGMVNVACEPDWPMAVDAHTYNNVTSFRIRKSCYCKVKICTIKQVLGPCS